MADRPSEKALQEFVSEAQEIVETLNRDLLTLDRQRVAGATDPDVVNDAFRAVHTLKGLSGLFGVSRMTHMAHALESLLDSVRLGRVAITPPILDLLFESVEVFGSLVADVSAGRDDGGVTVEAFLGRLAVVTAPKDAGAEPAGLGGYELDPGVLNVLTEYEEHRLKENVKAGRTLYRVHAAFDLMTIDKGLEELKGRLKPIGEVITYLPSSESGDESKIVLDVLVGSEQPEATVRAAVADLGVDVASVPRRAGAPTEGPGPVGTPPVPPVTMRGHAGAPDATARSAAGGAGPAPRAPAAPSPPPAHAAPAEATPRGPGAPPPPERAAAGQGAGGPRAGGSGAGGSGAGGPGAGGPGPGGPGPGGSGAGGPGAGGAEDASRAGPAASEEDRSLKSVSQTVRVDIRKLDHLMNIVGELALARAGIVAVLEELRQGENVDLARHLHRETRALERKLNELQGGILEVRMVPLGQVFDKLSRVVRKISREEGKEIQLQISGAETELDKLIVEELSDPLMHIIRNAIDHGIEDVETRRRHGKADHGTIAVRARQKGNHVVIEVADDGAGFDEERILEIALKRGLLDTATAADLSRRDLLNLVFLPGFSTRETVSEISGRGVGMDVVKTNIARLSGIIDVASARNRGSTMTITLPITLAIIQALVIRVAGRTYTVPLNSVIESLAIVREDLRTIEGREVLSVRGQTLPLVRLDALFALDRDAPAPDRQYVVVVGLAQHRLGLVVDELFGQQDIVIKSLGRALAGLPGIAGATELGGQQTVLVLDVASLVEEALRSGVPEVAA